MLPPWHGGHLKLPRLPLIHHHDPADVLPMAGLPRPRFDNEHQPDNIMMNGLMVAVFSEAKERKELEISDVTLDWCRFSLTRTKVTYAMNIYL